MGDTSAINQVVVAEASKLASQHKKIAVRMLRWPDLNLPLLSVSERISSQRTIPIVLFSLWQAFLALVHVRASVPFGVYSTRVEHA